MKKRLLIIGGALVVIILLAIPKINFDGGGDNSAASPASSQAIPVSVRIIQPARLNNTIHSNGSLLGNEEVELRSETSGKITKIYFQEGTKVKKGDLLVKINDADLQAQQLKNDLKQKLAEDKEFRYRKLLEKDLTSQQEYDAVLNELNIIKADIEYTKALIDKTEIRAPFDGVVGLRSVSEGSYITPSIKIATLQSTNPIKIEFAVPQKYYSAIKAGKAIHFTLPGTGKTYSAKIYAVEPKVDPVTRTILVRALVANDKGELVPGAYTEIDVVLDEIDNAMLIPTEALVPDASGEMVYLYKNGTAHPQNVKSGIRTETDVQILSGIQQGDTVITSGIVQLRAGAAVSINK